MSEKFDFIVVGAGIAGASAAASLREYGSVLVLETETHPGMHATGRSAALYAPGYGDGPTTMLTLASGPALEAGDPDGRPYLKRRGGLFLATVDQQASLDAAYDRNPRTFERIDAETTLSMIPVLKRSRILGALYDSVAADIDVDLLHQNYLRIVRSSGNSISCSEAMVAAAPAGAGWKVETSRRTLECGVLVNAAGAWADVVAQQCGLGGLALQPKRRTAALIEAPAVKGFEEWPAVIDVDERFYFKPDAGLLLVSPADETDVPAHDAYADDLSLAEGVERIADVAAIEVRKAPRAWAGLRTFAPDRAPVLGKDPRSEAPFIWCAGQGGYGIQTAPATGRLVACLATGSSSPSFADPGLLSQVSPERLLANQAP